MQPPQRRANRRGLSLLELLLGLAATAIVATAIAGMMGAVTAGVGSRRDARSIMVRTHAAASRLSAYIAPSRCVLEVNGPNVVLWFDDSRQGETVHASEVRWLIYDATAGVIDVYYVRCPDGWSRTACNLEDLQHPSNSNWTSVLTTYQSKGMVASRTIVDGLAAVDVHTDSSTAMSSRFVSYELNFQTDSEPVTVTTAAALTQHSAPVR